MRNPDLDNGKEPWIERRGWLAGRLNWVKRIIDVEECLQQRSREAKPASLVVMQLR